MKIGYYSHDSMAGYFRPCMLALMLSTFVACAQEPTIRPMEKTPPWLGVRDSPKIVSACAYNRILVGPKASSVATWREHGFRGFIPFDYRFTSDSFGVIFPSEKFSDSEVRKIDRERWSSPAGRVIPISYSTDGQYLWLIQHQYLAKVDVKRRKVISHQYLGWNPASLRLTGSTHGPADAILDPQVSGPMVEAVRGGRFDSVFATMGHGEIQFAVLPKASEEVLISSPTGGLIATGVPAGQMRKAYVLKGADGPKLATLGYNSGSHLPASIYAQPIVDLESGKAIGSFSPFGINADTVSKNFVEELKKIANGPIFIRDVSVSGSAVGALMSDFQGRVWVAASTSGEIRASLLCPDPKVAVDGSKRLDLEPGPVPPKVSEIFLDQSGASQAAAVLVQKNKRPSKNLLVYFHGGPGFSSIDDELYYFPRLLRNADVDIAIVEYSGSPTADKKLLESLRLDGGKALERDGEALKDFIERSEYNRVHLIGTSFGSLPVFGALRAGITNLCSVTLAVPLMRERRSRDFVASGLAMKPDAIYWHDRTGRSLVGGPDKFREFSNWIDSAKQLLTGVNASIFLAEGDPLSQPDDLPSDYPGNLVRMIKTRHSAIMLDRGFQKHLQQVVGKQNACRR